MIVRDGESAGVRFRIASTTKSSSLVRWVYASKTIQAFTGYTIQGAPLGEIKRIIIGLLYSIKANYLSR